VRLLCFTGNFDSSSEAARFIGWTQSDIGDPVRSSKPPTFATGSLPAILVEAARVITHASLSVLTVLTDSHSSYRPNREAHQPTAFLWGGGLYEKFHEISATLVARGVFLSLAFVLGCCIGNPNGARPAVRTIGIRCSVELWCAEHPRSSSCTAESRTFIRKET
jgi:hypothetical protein